MDEKGVCRQNKVENKQVLVLKMKDKIIWLEKEYCKKSKISYNIPLFLEENTLRF